MGASIGDTGREGENFENNVCENAGRIDYGLALDRSSVLCSGCSFYYITGVRPSIVMGGKAKCSYISHIVSCC